MLSRKEHVSVFDAWAKLICTDIFRKASGMYKKKCGISNGNSIQMYVSVLNYQ